MLKRTVQVLNKENDHLRECLINKDVNSQIQSTEENINDVIKAANSQIKKKQKEIEELKQFINKPDKDKFNDLPKEKLLLLKEYYKESLDIISEII